MNPRVLLGFSAVLVGVIGYVPYLYGFRKGTTTPHAFSWLVWGVPTAIAFGGQIAGGAGAGAGAGPG